MTKFATTDQVSAMMRALHVDSDAPSVEPVTLSGWYELTDGCVARLEWFGDRLRQVAVVRSWEDAGRYDRLDAIGLALFEGRVIFEGRS